MLRRYQVDTESEKSYPPLFEQEEFLERIIFLSYCSPWIFFILGCNLIAFYLATFYLCFHVKPSWFIYTIEGVCLYAATMDVVASIVHKAMKKPASYHCYKPASILYLVLMLALLIGTLVTSIYDKGDPHLKWLHLSLIFMRNVVKIFHVCSFYIKGAEAIDNMTQTMLILMLLGIVLILQLFASLWHEQCPSCVRHYVPYERIEEEGFSRTTYVVSLFFVLCGFTTVGYGGGRISTVYEQLLLILVSFISICVIKGLGYSTWAMFRTNEFSLDYLNHHYSALLRTNLEHDKHKYPRELRASIDAFFVRSVLKMIYRREPPLFEQLPRAVRLSMRANVYRMIIKHFGVFRRMPARMRHEMAEAIITRNYPIGTKIWDADAVQDRVMFVVEGNVRVMRPEDEDDAIVTFCIGTCFGTSFLLCPRKPRVSLYAVNFCTTHAIRFRDFWRIAAALGPQMSEKFAPQAQFLSRLKLARLDLEFRRRYGMSRIALPEVKSNLPRETATWGIQHDPYLKGNYFLTGDFLRYDDPTFLKTSRVWRFRPDSHLLQCWSTYMALLVGVVMLAHPLGVAFQQASCPNLFLALQLVVLISYPLDLLVESTTAMHSEREYEIDLRTIFRRNIGTWLYVLDIVAAVPVGFAFYLLRCADLLRMNRSVYNLIQLHCIVKSVKLPHYLKKFGQNRESLHSLKIMSWFMYCNYLWTCIYYAVFAESGESSWLAAIPEDLSAGHKLFVVYAYIIAITTLSDCYHFSELAEVYFVLFLMLFGITFYLYFLSSVTSTLIIKYKSKWDYHSQIETMRKYLASFRVPAVTQKRATTFLKYQWVYYSDTTEEGCYELIPRNLLRSIKTHRFLDRLREQAIFAGVDAAMLADIAQTCRTIFCPPNVLLLLEGAYTDAFYVVEKGNFEMTTSHKSDHAALLRPGGCFCLLETLMRRPSHYTYRAVTHATVIAIRRRDLDEIWRLWRCPLGAHISAAVAALNATLLPFRVFRGSEKVRDHRPRKVRRASWQTFSRVAKHASFKDFRRPLGTVAKQRVTKHFLLRRTVVAGGRFIRRYGRFFSIYIVVSAIAHPAMLLTMEASRGWAIFYVALLLIALGDMYLRLHMAFHNEAGILVTHPWCTAKHYLQTSFVTELVVMAPVDLALHYMTGIREGGRLSSSHLVKLMLSYTKLLYLYRYDGFGYISAGTLHSMSVFGVLLAVVPMILVGMNSLIMTYVYLNLMVDPESPAVNSSSWYYEHYLPGSEDINLGNLYINGLYWVTMTTLGNLPIQMHTYPYMTQEILMICACRLFGYYILMLLLAMCITIYHRKNNVMLMNHVRALELHDYMKRYRMKKRVKKWIFANLEYNWHQTLGMRTSLIANLPNALRNTCMTQLYSQLFRDTLLFAPFAGEMAQFLGPYLRPTFLLKQEVIVDKNDVTSKLYFILDGSVMVMNAVGTIQTVLTHGAIFGNIDECQYTRSMVSYVSMSNVYLLEIDTMEFYKRMQPIDGVKSAIDHHIRTVCVSYIKNVADEQFKFTMRALIVHFKQAEMTWKRFRLKLISPTRWCVEVASFASIYWVCYMAGFSKSDATYVIVFYAFDLLYVLRCLLVNSNRTARRFGHKLTKKQMRARYFRRFFALDLFAVAPFEAVAVFALDGAHANLLRLNRCARVVHFLLFMAEMYKSLKLDILAMNAISCASEITLFVHACACTLYYLACPRGACRPDSWILTEEVFAENHYLCSAYYATSIFTQSGSAAFDARLVGDRAVFVLIALVGRVLMFFTVCQIFMLVKYVMQDSLLYHYKYDHLKKYLHYTTITRDMRETVCGYLRNLYTHQRGNQLPVLMESLPSYMECAMKALVYGDKIFNNVLFHGCHHDFLRQVIQGAAIRVYFTHDLICHAGELNGTLYVIHEGCVEVVENAETSKETIIDELTEEDSFGVVQGLFENKAHLYTFKAKNVTTLILLERKRWQHLLTFFPASRHALYGKFNVPIRYVLE